MATTERPPEIFDVVDAPDGRDCDLYGPADQDPEPCGQDADFLFVYEASSRPDDDRRKNALACADCFTPPDDVDRTHGGDDA